MTFDEKIRLFDSYVLAQRRLLLLDYDGTLVPYFVRPDEAKPDPELITLLHELNDKYENEVVLISGRDALTIERWFGSTGIHLVAEHGAQFKKYGQDWLNYIKRPSDWEHKVEVVFEKYLRQFKGSFIEKKKYSLAFHYRAVDSREGEALKQLISGELDLLNTNKTFSVIQGNMVTEVRNSDYNKGTFVEKLLQTTDYDFILAIGDDTTDEDMFGVLKSRNNAFTIKVGIAATKAKCNFINVGNVISFLEQLNNYRGNRKKAKLV